jgi:hypothetical protein
VSPCCVYILCCVFSHSSSLHNILYITHSWDRITGDIANFDTDSSSKVIVADLKTVAGMLKVKKAGSKPELMKRLARALEQRESSESD